MMCCPSNKVIDSDTTVSFLALGGLHEDKLCDTFISNGTDQCQNG